MHLRFNQFGFHSALPFVLFIYGMGCQSAQAQQPVKAPVEVKVRPSTALPNSIITISGKSLALGKNNQVTIKVSPPSGTSPDIKATMDATGNYSISYKAGTMGKYRVLVTGADGKGSAETAFTVDSPGTEADEDSAATHKLIRATIKAEDIVDQQIPALPPSPAKDELEKKSDALKKSLAQVPAVQKKFEDALAKISDIESKDPEFLPALQPLYDELNADKEAIQTKEEQINRAIDEAKTNNATCDSLELFNQIFTLISESLDMIGKPWQKLLNVAMDKGTSKAIDAIAAKSTSEETKLKAGELAKVSVGFLSAGAEAANPMTLITVGIGLAADAGQYCVQRVFAKYCEKFEGPVSAQFRAEMRHNGVPWFTYKVTLRGKFQLRYTKDNHQARAADSPDRPD